MNRIYYRWSVIKTGAGTGLNDRVISAGYKKAGDALVGGGVTLPAKAITSLNTAVNQAMAMNRRVQADGLDTRLEVFGQVFDTNNEADRLLSGLSDDLKPRPANRIRELQISGTPPLDEAREQVYARLDTPEFYLKEVINLSNRAEGLGIGGILQANLDTSEDTEDVTVA